MPTFFLSNASVRFLICLALAIGMLSTGNTSNADVIINYEAQIATISGTPFGLSDADRNTTVFGFFEYNSATQDQNTNANRGDYSHDPARGGVGGGGFSATFAPNTVGSFLITGSDTPLVNIEDFASSETFRFRDGPDTFNAGGTMSLDGTLDSNIRLQFSMTDSSASSFADDSLPGNPFPMSIPGGSFPHTFAITEIDTGDTILLQLTSFQGVPEPGSLAVCVFLGLTATLRRRRNAR